mgnify:CR=1 FL=1
MPGQSSHFTPALPLTSQPQPCGRAGFSGFPSPAQDYEPCTLDLNTRLVKNPTIGERRTCAQHILTIRHCHLKAATASYGG